MIFYADNFPGRTITKDSKIYTYFGGTAYLGLQTDKTFQELFIKNVKKYGTAYSASRKSNVRFSVYEKAEAFLAQLVGSEACITISSGYLAGQLVSAYFNRPKYKTFYAPSTHPALHQKNTKNFSSFEALQAAVAAHIKNKPSVTPVLYFDVIDFNGNNYPGFDWIKSLPAERMILVADDSHGFGITGSHGEGSYRTLQAFDSKALVVCGSLGKGFGIQAGGIFGSSSFISELMETHMFAASSPPPPYTLATFLQAQAVYTEKRKTLLNHIEFFKEKINYPHRFRYMENYPTFTYSEEALSGHLLKNNIVVTNFKYPDEDADTPSRIVLSAHHTGTDILDLVTAINCYPTKPLH